MSSRQEEQKLNNLPSATISASLGKKVTYNVGTIKLTSNYVNPSSINRLDKSTTLYDFKQVSYGTLQINTHTKTIPKLTVTLSERLNTPTNESARYSFGYFTKTYTNIKGKIIIRLPERHLPTTQTLPDDITGVIPFRYARIKTNSNENISVQQIAIHYPISKNSSTFKSSSEALNKLWKLSKHTIIASNFADLYVDGNRERLPYEADAYFSQLTHQAIDSDYILARNTLLYLVNNPTWPLEWSFDLISIAYQDYIYTGDKAFLNFIYPYIVNRLFLENIDKDGLLVVANDKGYQLKIDNQLLKPIIDWPPSERTDFYTRSNKSSESSSFNSSLLRHKLNKFKYDLYGMHELSYIEQINIQLINQKNNPIAPNNTVIYSYWYDALLKMAYLSKEIGLNTNYESFQKQASIVKNSLNKLMFNRHKMLFNDSIDDNKPSFHSNLFAMSFNLPTKSRKKAIANYLVKNQYRASVFSSYYLLKAFFDNKLIDEALKYMTSEHTRSWSSMINNGATLTMESWNSKIKPNLDWSHPWGATPAYFIIRELAGVKPLKPGFKKVIIAPNPGYLTWFAANAKTPIGNIKILFNHSKNKEKYTIDLPDDNVEIFQLSIPIKKNKQLKKLIINKSLIDVSPHHNRVIIPTQHIGKLNLVEVSYVDKLNY